MFTKCMNIWYTYLSGFMRTFLHYFFLYDVSRSNVFVNIRDLKKKWRARARLDKDFLFKKCEFEKLFDYFSH